MQHRTAVGICLNEACVACVCPYARKTLNNIILIRDTSAMVKYSAEVSNDFALCDKSPNVEHKKLTECIIVSELM